MSTRLPLPDGRVISVPDDLTADEVEVIIQQEMGTAEPPTKAASKEKIPKDWKEAGSLALESLGKTAGDIGYVATHGPETAAAMDAAFNASAKRFGEDPLGTAWGGIKSTAQGIKEGARTGLVTATGLVGSIPGAPLLEEALGGDPEALQRHIDEAKRNIAYRPIGTALDVAGIVPGAAVAGRGLAAATRGTGRLLSGDLAAERLLGAGITPELRMRQAQYGPEATSLDVQPPAQRDRALSYVGTLPRAEVAPMRDTLRRRELLGGERHRELVEEAEGLRPGALLTPRGYSGAARARSRAVQEQFTEQATRQRDEAVRARNEASAARTEAARTERNELYPRAFEQHADMPLDNYADILETPLAQNILAGFAADEATLQAARGHGIGNLEQLDKLELQLTRDMEDFSPGTIAWNTRRELAQQIRDRLARQFEGVPEMEDYRNARLLHARVANAPEPAEVPARQVHMPQEQRDRLNAEVARAQTTERLATPETMRRLRDRSPPDIRDERIAHLAPDIMQGGTNRERAFEELRRAMPAGTDPGTWNAIRRNLLSIVSTGSTAGLAAALHSLLGMPMAGAAVGVGATLLGGAQAIRRGHQKRIGRRILERTMNELPEPVEFSDANLPVTLLGRRQGTP